MHHIMVLTQTLLSPPPVLITGAEGCSGKPIGQGVRSGFHRVTHSCHRCGGQQQKERTPPVGVLRREAVKAVHREQ